MPRLNARHATAFFAQVFHTTGARLTPMFPVEIAVMDAVFVLILIGLYVLSGWMSAMYWLAGLLALFLFGYLLYALFKAEKF